MASELINFDATKQAIANAKNVTEVLTIRDKMIALAAFYKSGRDPENARKANGMRLLSEARIGEMSMTLEKEGGPGRGNKKTSQSATSFSGKYDTLKAAGISKQDVSVFERLAKLPKDELAKAVDEGKKARGILNAKPLTSDELKARGLSPKTERYHTEGGGDVSRIKLTRDALVEALALIAERDRLIVEKDCEIATLRSDLEALQTGHVMRMSQAALAQRRALIEKARDRKSARAATETVPDQKTKESYEREISRLKSRLRNERSKVGSFMANGKRILSGEDHKLILSRLHPDNFPSDPVAREKQEMAFKLFNAAFPRVKEEANGA